jgi:hypothetical protein
MSNETKSPAPHAGEKEPTPSEDGQTPGTTKAPTAEKQPSKKPSFSSTEDDPLATAGTGGSEDLKGKVRPGGDEVPADSDALERRNKRLDEADS